MGRAYKTMVGQIDLSVKCRFFFKKKHLRQVRDTKSVLVFKIRA